jgi:hypothetical protein
MSETDRKNSVAVFDPVKPRSFVVEVVYRATRMKQILVKIWLAKEGIRRGVSLVFRPVKSTLAIVAGGLWNAKHLSADWMPHDTILFTYHAEGGVSDLTRFCVELANVIARPERERCNYVDLILLADDGAAVPEYLTVARFFGKRINAHVGRDASVLERVVPAVVPRRLVKLALDFDRRDSGAFELAVGAVNFRAPALYANLARDFLKGTDCRKKYCFLCFGEDWDIRLFTRIETEISRRYPEWKFVVGSTTGRLASLPDQTSSALIWPGLAGLDFGTQIALAMEVDAVIGPRCIFTLAAILGRRDVAFVDEASIRSQYSAEMQNLSGAQSAAGDGFVVQLERLLSGTLAKTQEGRTAFS